MNRLCLTHKIDGRSSVIMEALITGAVDAIAAFFQLLSGLGLNPTWPSWVTGTGDGTVTGAFNWVSTGLTPMAAWINLPLLGSIMSLFVLLQVGFVAWGVIARAFSVFKAAMPV